MAEAMALDEKGLPLKFKRQLTEDEQAVFDKWIINCLADVGVAIDIRGEYPVKRPLPRELVELVE